MLANATLLAHPQPNAPIALTTDASDVAVAAVLEQSINGLWQPLAFFSRQLRPAELKYSAFDRELLALYLAIRHFRFMLEGRVFSAYTDHKPLVQAISKSTEPWTARQQRHLAYISEFPTDIRHVLGKNNVVADCLSRPTLNNVSFGVDYSDMARAQSSDKEVQASLSTSTGLKIVPVPLTGQNLEILCDLSTGRPRPLVPPQYRRQIFDAIHNLAHPGVRSTRRLIAEKYVWQGLNKQVNKWARECIHCQTSKTHKHTRAPLEKVAVPERRFSHIHVDIVGPLPSSEGFTCTHLFTIIDRSTRWPEAIPLKDTSTITCANALVSGWISRYGVPLHMTSDRGSQFTSTLWSAMAEQLGIKIHRTTAYHPASNGLVERFHRSLKTALKARLQGPKWTDQLPWVMLGLRTTPKEDIQASIAEMVYGEPLTVPGDFVTTNTSVKSAPDHLSKMRTFARSFSSPPTTIHGKDTPYFPAALKQAKYVFIRHDAHRSPLQRPYHGPYKVVATGDKTFKVDVGNREETVSVDRLKPAHIDESHPVPTAQSVAIVNK